MAQQREYVYKTDLKLTLIKERKVTKAIIISQAGSICYVQLPQRSAGVNAAGKKVNVQKVKDNILMFSQNKINSTLKNKIATSI